MKDKTVKDAMTPLESVFMLNYNDKIGHSNMEMVQCINSLVIIALYIR